MGIYEIALITAGTVSMLLSGGCFLWVSTRSTSAALQAACKSATLDAAYSRNSVEKLELRQLTWKGELDGYLDQVSEQLERSSTKLRRANAVEAKQAQRETAALVQVPDITEMDRETQVAEGRRRVYGGVG